MKKQTVQERYDEQQTMKQGGSSQPAQLTPDPQMKQQQLQQIFRQTDEAVQQAHQAVRQALAGNPLELQLQQADQRLTFAQQQLQQMKTTAPEIATGIQPAAQTQLKELERHLQQAGKTLSILKNSFVSG